MAPQNSRDRLRHQLFPTIFREQLNFVAAVNLNIFTRQPLL
jgi:hypothetical protein